VLEGTAGHRDATRCPRFSVFPWFAASFFQAGADKCAGQIIGYRFVVWLNNDRVAVGFNTSPYCRQSRDRKADGMDRILIFDLQGTMAASRDVPYLADGYGEMVADGEAEAGPGGTLLFRIQSVNLDPQGANESKSAVLLLDANLKDVIRLDRLLEQATFLNYALVFQEGFTLNGPAHVFRSRRFSLAQSSAWVHGHFLCETSVLVCCFAELSHPDDF
jgi:hypothetical protein